MYISPDILNLLKDPSVVEGLERLEKAVREVNYQNGWFDEDRDFSADVALLHSEVSEAFEAYRKNDWDNLAEELADVFIRLLDTVGRYNVDLAAETIKKIKANAGRGYRHGGKVV